MKLKIKFISVLLFMALSNQCNTAVFADETSVNTEVFNASNEFSKYESYEDIEGGRFFSVSNSEDENNKAIFDESVQVTDFIYDSILPYDGYSFIVTQNINGIKTYGALDFEYFKNKEYENNSEIEYRLPIKYKNIECREINSYSVFIAENFDGSKEYYIDKNKYINDKVSIKYNSTYDIEYTEFGKLIKLNSIEDVPNPTEYEKKPIDGLNECYIMESGFFVNIVDKDGNKLIDIDFREVDNKLSPGETIVVWYPEGMSDLSGGVLSKDLKVIVPQKWYKTPSFIEENGKIYIKAEKISGEGADYYDLQGNLVKEPVNGVAIKDVSSNENNIESDDSLSDWAKEIVDKAINLGLVPENLQSKYKNKITRAEFCKLAIQTYISKTGNNIDMDAKTPFTDVDDVYITAAYNLKIVSGVGNNKFAPDNNITRQEAAVMLDNMVSVFEIDKSNPKKDKFVDESYFAKWAKDEIYSVSGIKSEDTFVMTGTGNGKFSPWMNYTREQAIATMLRLYNCKTN